MSDQNKQESVDQKEGFRSGFAAMIGRPNAGKSTFMNTIIGEDVSAVSHVPQTTQKTIRGIHSTDDVQIIFHDVAWLHKSEKKWNEAINSVARKSLRDVDVVIRFVDVSREYGEEEEKIDALLHEFHLPVIVVFSKADRLLPDNIVLTEKFKEPMMLSSKTGEWMDELIEKITWFLPKWPALYNTEMYTDQDMYTRIEEIVREQVCLKYTEEIPHSVYIQVEHMEDTGTMLKMDVTIACETESQKRILVGSKGDGVKSIGTDARKKLERIFDKKVFLRLKMKTHKNWRKNDGFVRDRLG